MARDRATDRRLLWETIFLLAVSLGQSAWYSILRMIERLTRGVPMGKQIHHHTMRTIVDIGSSVVNSHSDVVVASNLADLSSLPTSQIVVDSQP